MAAAQIISALGEAAQAAGRCVLARVEVARWTGAARRNLPSHGRVALWFRHGGSPKIKGRYASIVPIPEVVLNAVSRSSVGVFADAGVGKLYSGSVL